jgi:hypothetical protein
MLIHPDISTGVHVEIEKRGKKEYSRGREV